MQVTAVIAAGGRGVRFGGGTLKQLQGIEGRSILQRSVDAFVTHPGIGEVIVAVPAELVSDPPAGLSIADSRVRLVAGGARRQDSVANAVRAAAEASDIIIVHDAARPFVSADLITRTIEAAAKHGAALAATRSRDTVKRVERAGGDADFQVAETIPRDTIYLAQTPQAFRREVLMQALTAAHGAEATDEAALVERAGHPVHIVEGDAFNIKITTREDLDQAKAIAATQSAIRNPQSAMTRPARTGRAGTGYDLHRLVEGRPLVIGGVTIPAGRGAMGHSDADVVCHAITDAILGAACLGDIGRHFPDDDPRWKHASSLDMLARVVTLIADEGYEVGNVDVTVILQTPKIKPHIDAMRTALAQVIGIDPSRVSVKGKTNEGVDAVGRGEAIAAHAIALIRSK
ncbi:MAG TPA: 2-C-methyl-D-erythritol 4-phosphate cytidylyltransferase [Vicinamibacterales bacterium]|jgi:2-C-methyl-D-erythritol 4-phosphate cytidylyltransferase/2-C-methyl-D-erythritol 2,4-cyclodiphosphate synthase